jgi:PAS domain S-box-containing protein
MSASHSSQASSSVEDILITPELFLRKSRPPDLTGENRALVALAHEAAQNPKSLIQKLVEITAELCHAGSAGISLLENSPGGAVFRWRAVAGQLAAYQGTSTPRDACTCGVCLDRQAPQLFYRPERHFSDLGGIEPRIYEALVVPISGRRNFWGTLWAVNHDEERKFDPEDLRLMSHLAEFGGAALQLLRSIQSVSQAKRELEGRVRRRTLALRNERNFNENLISCILDGVFAFDRECRYTIWNPAMEKIMRISRDEVLGKNAFELFPFLKETGEDEYFLKALRGESATAKNRVYEVHETGEQRFFDVHYCPIWQETGLENGERQIIGGLGLVKDITERKLAEDSLRELSGRLLQLQDEERRRIARDLHDSTSQTVAALLLQLKALQNSLRLRDSKKQAALEECMRLAEQCGSEIRTVSYLLHPPMLDEAGLNSALRWYVRGFAERSGIDVSIHVAPELQRLPSEIEIALFRIIQEALANIHRHSGSPTADIRIALTSKELVLEVKDQGCGMPAEVAQQKGGRLGVGIRGMRERVRQLGGELHIFSGREGATVRATLPLAGEKVRAASQSA